MAWLFAGLCGASVIYGLLTGAAGAVSQAAVSGCVSAVELILATGGMLCLWSGLMSAMHRSGLSAKLSRLLSPVIGLLFPSAVGRPDALRAISENMSANLLGLANAATPAGLRAASLLEGRELYMLVVINSASIQLLPTTIAAVRQAAGAASAFDILLPVWITSLLSVLTGVLAVRLLYARGE